jgi:hypothetical protein
MSELTKSGLREAQLKEMAAALIREPTWEEVLQATKDQGYYSKAAGAVCSCQCGRKRQVLGSCKCGAS